MKTKTNPLTRGDLITATQILADTERGRQAMRDLFALIDNGGDSLDIMNQRAVSTLLACQFGPFAGSTREAIKAALKSPTNQR